MSKIIDRHIWKRMMKRYGLLMLVGIVTLIALFPFFHTHEAWVVGLLLLGGLAVFGGFFGIAVSLFFHLWHGKKSE